MSENSLYFPHDFHSRSDPKTIKLIKDGWENYGIYWAIVEMIHEQEGYLPKDYETIAYELRTECERIRNVVESYGLFIVENNKITSLRILKNISHRNNKSTKATQSANARWHKNANALPTNNESNAIKEKKRKEKKIFTPPTIEEVRDYCKEINSSINPDSFFHSYQSQGWIKANNQPVLNWKSTIRTWENRNKGDNSEKQRRFINK